jgi:hypothetical protein
MRFEERKDCFYDNETGLEWSLETYDRRSWQDAIHACLAFGNGWKLPTIHELITLIDYEKINPATDLPKMEADYYWSSSTSMYYRDYAWLVDFDDGYVYYHHKTYHYRIRCVRGD